VIELPEKVVAKLADLQFACDTAQDDARASDNRLRSLGDQLPDQIRDRLLARRDENQRRHTDLFHLIARIKKWLNSVPPTKMLQLASVEARPRDGETIAQAIVTVRTELARCQVDLTKSKNAPPTKAELKAAACDQVARLARGAAPWIDPRGSKLINFGDPRAATTFVERETPWAFFCWLDPTKATAKVTELIDALPVPEGAMTTAEKAKSVAALTAKIEQLEDQEEALILVAAIAGHDVLRRPNASPAAVLQVRVVERPIEEELDDESYDDFEEGEEEIDETADAEVADEEAA
jgi:hypothetical protein